MGKVPDGKKHIRNIYAHSKEGCEGLLVELIARPKEEKCLVPKMKCGVVKGK